MGMYTVDREGLGLLSLLGHEAVLVTQVNPTNASE